jgi:hypothetical protein
MPDDPKPRLLQVKNDASLHVEIVNLASNETYVLSPPYELAIHVDYANAFAANTVRVELHQTADLAAVEAGTFFLDAVTGLAGDSDGTIIFTLAFPYDTTDVSFTPRIVREDNAAIQTIGLSREHLTIISGGM